jgi:hypothetical protein
MLSNLHRNTLGTVSFNAKFDGMRKAQEFDVYPMQAGDDLTRVVIQSDTRYGYLYLNDGRVFMSPPVAGGAYSHHLVQGKFLTPISAEDLLLLKSHILSSASAKAGNHGVVCDNSQATAVFGNLEAVEND